MGHEIPVFRRGKPEAGVAAAIPVLANTSNPLVQRRMKILLGCGRWLKAFPSSSVDDIYRSRPERNRVPGGRNPGDARGRTLARAPGRSPVRRLWDGPLGRPPYVL